MARRADSRGKSVMANGVRHGSDRLPAALCTEIGKTTTLGVE